MTEENIHGAYGPAIEMLRDIADGGRARRESEKIAVDAILTRAQHKPQSPPKYSDPLLKQMMKSTGG